MDSLRFSEVEFSYFPSQVRLSFVEKKRNLKFWGLKTQWREESENVLLSYYVKLYLKFSAK